MAEVVRCDQCGKITDQPGYALGWQRLEWIAALQQVGDDPRARHFCTMRCLRDYAASNETYEMPPTAEWAAHAAKLP